MAEVSSTHVTEPTKFWIEDPCILFSDLVFFPTAGMTREQKLNALTRLAITISVGMYIAEYKHWSTFLLGSVLFLVVVEYAEKAKDKKKSKEGFSIVPTRINDDFHETIVAPIFAEEVRIPPPAYEMESDVDFTDIPFEAPMRPQSYPYGQYLTRTNLMPSDEYLIHMNPTGGAKNAREFANSSFTKHTMAFRENMTRIHKKSLDRRFRHTNLNDSFSPFTSY
jgi:hypothetical protein